jgi:HD-GYP domain-containing protein (c-di-GMP phosphodiesterase class II)
MTIHIFADSSEKFLGLHGLLNWRTVSASLLDNISRLPKPGDAVIVRADLTLARNILTLKLLVPKIASVEPRVFVVEAKNRLAVVQALALSATHVLENPVDKRELLDVLGLLETSKPQLSSIGGAQEVSAGGARSLASMFADARNGTHVDVADAKQAAARIADSIAEDGLANWLKTVRHHHEGTYQHCLLVIGVAVEFGLKIGLPRIDIERLSFAAMLHDVGKARIPLSVLDKPGKLNTEERALIETHPAAGYDALKETPGISQEALDAVRHHHEYLDGSGYPDGLCASGISDIVRILTIADIFAALIEDRRYKPVMPRAEAYEILWGMRGKLEAPLVAAFKQIALAS